MNTLLTISGWVGFIVTLISLYFSIKGHKPDPKLMYYIASKSIFEKDKTTLNDLKLYHQEEEIPRLTRTAVILFKDKSKTTIFGKQIHKDEPLRIEFAEGFKIVEYSIVKMTRKVNNFELKKIKDNVLAINFEFLDFHDGICIDIYHTGDISSPRITGTFIGLRNVLRNVKYKAPPLKIFLGFIALGIFPTIILFNILFNKQFPFINNLLLLGIMFIMVLSNEKFSERDIIPKELRSIFLDIKTS